MGYYSKLLIKNDLEFQQLSDGEYQLLSIYALIDLFDEVDTVFLLDEVDFIEKEKSKVKIETSKNFMELVQSAPKSSGAKASKNSAGNLQTEDEDFFRAIGLIND